MSLEVATILCLVFLMVYFIIEVLFVGLVVSTIATVRVSWRLHSHSIRIHRSNEVGVHRHSLELAHHSHSVWVSHHDWLVVHHVLVLVNESTSSHGLLGRV